MSKCAYSFDHYVSQPISLQCGHSMCKSCIPIDAENNDDELRVICKLCGQVNDIVLSKAKSKEHIYETFRDLEKRISLSLQILKDSINDHDNLISSKIDEIKEEVDSHATILKKEIDRINNKLQKEIDNYKDKLLRSSIEIDIKGHENNLDNLRDDLSNKNTTHRNLSRYEANLRTMNDEIDSLERRVNVEVSFEPCEQFVFDQSVFGNINFGNYSKENTIITLLPDKLKHGNFQVMEKNIEISDLCELPTGEILVASCNQHNMTLYDKFFKLIKMINRINGKLFSPLSLTTDNEERIFICDSFNQHILMTNLDFKFLDEFGGYGNGKDKLKYPNCVSYSHNELYVSDRANSRVIKLTPYLKHIASFEVGYQPSTIKIINYVACVKAANQNLICFYDLSFPPYFNFIKQYDHHSGTLSIVNYRFLEFNYENKKIYCFDKDGSLDKVLSIKSFSNELDFGSDSSFYQVTKHLFVNSSKDRLLVKI